MRQNNIIFILLLTIGLLLAACGATPEPTAAPPMQAMDIPADLDTATTRLSDGGLFRAAITPNPNPIPLNQMHTWTLHLETAAGRPVEDAAITGNGGMPQHGHGLSTQPQVTQNLGGGDYLVEGLKFQMGGWWQVVFAINAGGKTDSVTFNLLLN